MLDLPHALLIYSLQMMPFYLVNLQALKFPKLSIFLILLLLSLGRMINLAKSGLVCADKVPNHTKEALFSIIQVPIWDSPGLPWNSCSMGRVKSQALQYHKERILNKYEGWKGNLLNQAGKEALIKFVIQDIPSYIMSILRLPKNFCKSITSVIYKFRWSSGQKIRGIHWQNWNSMCNPKSKGGMRFRNFHRHNFSLLSKQAWIMHQNPNHIG